MENEMKNEMRSKKFEEKKSGFEHLIDDTSEHEYEESCPLVWSQSRVEDQLKEEAGPEETEKREKRRDQTRRKREETSSSH